jgi:gamma-butyrobetaine dioxygenase
MVAGTRFEVNGNEVLVIGADGRRPVPALWLRERSQDERARDLTTGQRFFNPHELPENLAVAAASIGAEGLDVTFSDGFSCRYRLDVLAQEIEDPDLLPEPRKWLAAEGAGTIFDWPLLESSDEQALACLEQFFQRGFAIIRNTPTARDSILTIARRFGFVRETNFGAFFEVYSRPVSNDLAYRAVPLAPHTDNPYRDPVPGIQLLHCLVNETSGGHSTLVDGLAVCDRLIAEDPEAFRLLTEIPVGFRFRDPDAHLRAFNPLIETNRVGEPTGVHYSPRLDETPLLDPETMVAFHRARKRLGQLLSDPEFEFRFLLNPGELMMFDNNRVLHGRTGYDPNEGMRHLQGCYIDRDGPESLYRVLTARRQKQAEAA